MRGDWKDEAMQYRDVDRAAQKQAEEAMSQTPTRASETPRTDALWISHGPQPAVLSYQQYRDMLDLARTLERELAERELADRDATIALLREALQGIETHLGSLHTGPYATPRAREVFGKASAALAKATP